MKFYTCRDDGALIPVPNSRRLALRAVMMKDFFSPKRPPALGHRADAALRTDVVYAGHTGICIEGDEDVALHASLYRATDEAWRAYGLQVVRAELVPYPGGVLPELVLYFVVASSGDATPSKITPMFQLVLPHGTPMPTSVNRTVRAPAPGIKYAADKAVVTPQTPGRNPPTAANPHGGAAPASAAAAEAAGRAWLMQPDTAGKVVTSGAAQPPTPLSGGGLPESEPVPMQGSQLVDSVNLGGPTDG